MENFLNMMPVHPINRKTAAMLPVTFVQRVIRIASVAI